MKKSIRILLLLDLDRTVRSLGLTPSSLPPPVSEENLFAIINEIEIALLEGGQEKDISSVCGLLWTHFHSTFDLLAGYVYEVMAKIGFAPVAKMLSTGDGENSNKIQSSSLFSMLETSVQMKKEAVTVFETTYSLTRFQKELWDVLKTKKHVAVSAPTSAGKSFLICLDIVVGISLRKGTSVYVVPTLTLMGQVVNDLVHLARLHDQKLDVRTHLSDSFDTDSAVIYVVTQERLTDHAEIFKSIKALNYLVIDEVQNIERAFEFANNDSRAKLLLDVIIDLHDSLHPAKTIICGPRITEISMLGEKIFRKPCAPVTASASPVTNICYSISPYISDASKISVAQYSELDVQHLSQICDNDINATGFGKKQYTESYHEYLSNVLAGNDGSLIFSPTSGQARKTALRLAGDRNSARDELLNSLADYIEATVAKNYDLAVCIRKGVAYHHGKMPHHVRNAVELAIGRGRVGLVACTTTLMQGVNIPARAVVMRNPNLFVKVQGGQAPRLSAYEIANLRGRAGRLLRDFVGRTFILDGTSFEEVEAQSSLFQPAAKELDGSYASVFSRNRNEIISSLSSSEFADSRSPIAKYISNVLYTEPDGAALLSRKGILLTDLELVEIKRAQRLLTVEKAICRNHRYWDPFDLQVMHEQKDQFNPPTSPFVAGGVDKLNATLAAFVKLLPSVAQNFMGQRNIASESKVWVIARTAFGWASEVPLRELLDNDYARASGDNTDASISLLQNTISYGLPAMLSPLYAMLQPGSLMLGAMERGVYHPISTLQINNNIPRETAITVTKLIKKSGVKVDAISDVIRIVSNSSLSYWDIIQFRHLLDISKLRPT